MKLQKTGQFEIAFQEENEKRHIKIIQEKKKHEQCKKRKPREKNTLIYINQEGIDKTLHIQWISDGLSNLMQRKAEETVRSLS